MSLTDILKDTTAPAAPMDRQPGITCETYAPGEGKRCRHYLDGGTCALPDQFLCVEWARVNGHRSAPGEAMPGMAGRGEAGPGKARQGEEAETAARREQRSLADPPRQSAAGAKVLAGSTPALAERALLTREDAESFRKLGVEVELRSPLGTFWLVPARTGRDRMELTPEDAITLANVVHVFGDRLAHARRQAASRCRPGGHRRCSIPSLGARTGPGR